MALNTAHLIHEGKSAQTITQFLCGAAFLHNIAGYQNPVTGIIVLLLRDVMNRECWGRADRKDQVTADMLREIRTALFPDTESWTLSNIRIYAMMLIKYARVDSSCGRHC